MLCATATKDFLETDECSTVIATKVIERKDNPDMPSHEFGVAY